MKLGIIGAGWLGGTVGQIWAKAGHDVIFSSRQPEKLSAKAAKLAARTGSFREAAEHSEAILIAIPYGALPQLADDVGDVLAGKIVLDACNPYTPDPLAFRREIEAEGVALASARLLPGARLVRAFSAVDATAVEESALGERKTLGVPLASDDPEA
jgi:predicted dinucleotide-binding enzyme